MSCGKHLRKLLVCRKLETTGQQRTLLNWSQEVEHPVEHVAGARPNVIYCHGLGGAWNLPLPVKMQQYVTQYKKCGFTRFQYRNVQDMTKVWHVNNWLEDIIRMLDLMYEEVGPQIVMASSAGAHPALNATIERPEKVHSLLLLAPGVGLDLTYMDRVVPGAVSLLQQGKRLVHPGLKGGYDALVDITCLNNYVNSCVSNVYPTQIPITCPVRILHGKKDQLVPWQNSVQFANKLQSNDVNLLLLEEFAHSITLTSELLQMIDQLIAKQDRLPPSFKDTLNPLPDFVVLHDSHSQP